jgi:putative NADH-flavin reductase
VRSPDKITERHEALRAVKGDVFDSGGLARAIAGHDAVLSAFGPRTLRTTTLRRDFGRALASAMKQCGVNRLQLVSAAFLFNDIGVLGALLKPTLFRFMGPDMAAMEREVMKEPLQWTVLRPPRLTDGPLTGAYRVADGALPAGSSYTVSRADVADFMIREAEAPAWVQRVVGIVA